MTNAAHLLADFLAETRVTDPGKTTHSVRRAWGERRGGGGSTAALYGARMLVEVHDLLKDLEANKKDIGYLAESLPDWVWGVFLPDGHWGEAGAHPDEVSPENLRFLRALGARVEDVGLEPEIEESDITAIEDSLAEIEEVVSEAGLPQDVRFYVRALIGEAWDIVNNVEEYSGTRVRKFSIQLGGAMHVVADYVEEHTAEDDDTAQEQVSRLRRVARKVSGGLIAGGSSELGRRAIGGATKAIEAGLGG